MLTLHRRTSPARTLVSALAVAIVLLTARSTGRAATGALGDLADLFARGEILQDRNGDGIVDFVNCRIVVAA